MIEAACLDPSHLLYGLSHFTYDGLMLYENKLLQRDIVAVQYRFPASKKKRIRNKWKKRAINFKPVELRKFIVRKDEMHVDSKTYEELLDQYGKQFSFIKQ